MKVYTELVMIMELVNFATAKNLEVKSTIFPHCNIHKFTWTSHDGEAHNETNHIFVEGVNAQRRDFLWRDSG
jgi:hypothetical protein